jgi:DNA excision repair protein ERCC-4
VKKSDKCKGKEKKRRKSWISDDMDPVLEELPTWSSLAGVLRRR